MEYLHTGLVASTTEQADRFYIGILGMKKTDSMVADRTLMQQLFGINEDGEIVKYQDGNTLFEVFVRAGYRVPQGHIPHSCIKVQDLSSVVAQCKAAGLEVVEAIKGNRVITFISDFDGNRFEMK